MKLTVVYKDLTPCLEALQQLQEVVAPKIRRITVDLTEEQVRMLSMTKGEVLTTIFLENPTLSYEEEGLISVIKGPNSGPYNVG